MDDIFDPAVILGDQAAGLIKAVNILDIILNSVLQFCNWYAIKVMRTKFNKAEYTTEELNGQINNEIKIPGLINLF